jgi:hypothetical protein
MADRNADQIQSQIKDAVRRRRTKETTRNESSVDGEMTLQAQRSSLSSVERAVHVDGSRGWAGGGRADRSRESQSRGSADRVGQRVAANRSGAMATLKRPTQKQKSSAHFNG